MKPQRNLLTAKIADSNWSEVILLYSGLFENENGREEFVIDLSEVDILLAAECKMTSINEEETIEVEILKRAFYSYKDNDDYLSIVTLLKMQEYHIATDLFNYKFDLKINETIAINAILRNTEPLDFLDQISKNLPKEVISNIIQIVSKNTTDKDYKYYLSLSKVINNENVLELYAEVSNSIHYNNPDILFFLLKNCNRDQANILFYDIKKKLKTLTVNIINQMILISDDIDAFNIYNELKAYNLNPNLETFKYLIRKKNKKNDFIINEVFDYLIKSDLIKNSRHKNQVWIPYILYQEEYKIALYYFNEFIIEKNIKNQVDKPAVSQLKMISHLIKISPNFEIANKWFLYSLSEFDNDLIPSSIYENYLFINSDNKVNDFIEVYYENLFKDFKKTLRQANQKKEVDYFVGFFNKFLKLKIKFNSLVLILSRIQGISDTIPDSIWYDFLNKFSEKDELKYLITNYSIYHKSNPRLLTSVLSKSTYIKGALIIEILNSCNVAVNIIHYNSVLKNSQDYSFAINLYKTIKNKAILPDKFTFTHLINLSITVENFFFILMEMNNYKINFDDYLINSIRKKVNMFDKVYFIEYYKKEASHLSIRWILDVLN